MSVNIIKAPNSGELFFTDADTEFIVASDTVPSNGEASVTGKLTLAYSSPEGEEKETNVSLNFPRLKDGWGVSLADVLRDFFPRVDFSRAGKCFSQDCSVTVKSISYTFYDSAGAELDTGGVIGYNAIFIFDPGLHGYTDIYKQEHFLMLTAFTPMQKNGLFAFSYMQSLSQKTSVYLVSPDGQEKNIAVFDHNLFEKYFYNISGRFDTPSARLEIRNTDTGAVLAHMDMVSHNEESYDEHLLFVSSDIGTPELFVFTGAKSYDVKTETDVFESLHKSVLADASAFRSVTVNSGYIDEQEYLRLVSFFPVKYECSVDGLVCMITGADLNFTHGQKNNVSITFRPKWN